MKTIKHVVNTFISDQWKSLVYENPQVFIMNKMKKKKILIVFKIYCLISRNR
jgi:hypothetical protein